MSKAKEVDIKPELTVESIADELSELGIDEKGEFKNAETSKKEESTKEKEEERVLEVKEQLSKDPEMLAVVEEEDTSRVEKEALQKGWKADGPKSAEEFLRAEPLYDELKQRGKDIKELKETVSEMKTLMAQQREAGYEQALGDLERLKADAIRAGDVDTVSGLDDQIKTYETELGNIPGEPVTPNEMPEVKSFYNQNKFWIEDTSHAAQQIREFAQKRDLELVPFKLAAQKHLDIIQQDIEKQFPDTFKSTSDTPKAVVESDKTDTVRIVSKKGKLSFADLSPEQKKCARHFEKNGVMSVEKYIDELKNVGEIG